MSEALDSSGNVTAQQLYIPYGGSRYTNGTMPTAKGFTGQRADSTSSKLDYYGARYYDPVLGQFASADTVADGLNRYGYVHGNPTTFNDPSGHLHCASDGSDCDQGDGHPHGGGGGNGKCDSCNYDDSHIHIRPNNDDTSANKSGATVGQGQQVQADDGESGSVYEWCTANNNCVHAYGYSGKSLESLIGYYKGHLRSAQDFLALIIKWGTNIAFWGGILIGVIVGAIVAFATKNPWSGLKVGATVASWTSAGLFALLEAVRNKLEDDVATLTNRVSNLQKVFDAGKSIWYIRGTYDNSPGSTTWGDDYVVDNGPTPGFAVRYQIGNILWRQCAEGVGWDHSSLC